jgi:UDP-N-acetylglucosamine kinase
VTVDVTEVGTEQWLRRVFDLAAREAIFPQSGSARRAAPAKPPRLVLLGGQPAAGKTSAQKAILAQYPDLTPLSGDSLRGYHPAYEQLVTNDPLGMPNATNAVSGGLVRLALGHALDCRYSVLLEGVFRDAGTVVGTAERFAAAGYSVEVVGVATPAPVSRLSAEQRYLGAPAPWAARWTPPSAHESALTRSPAVVAALETSPAVARVQLFTRTRPIYDNRRTPDGAWRRQCMAGTLMHHEQTRDFAPGEAASWLDDYDVLFDLAKDHAGYLNARTLPAYRLLQRDAVRLMRRLQGVTDVSALKYRHLQRAATLNQRDPTQRRRKPSVALPGALQPGRLTVRTPPEYSR